jgi:hypothetical protein
MSADDGIVLETHGRWHKSGQKSLTIVASQCKHVPMTNSTAVLVRWGHWIEQNKLLRVVDPPLSMISTIWFGGRRFYDLCVVARSVREKIQRMVFAQSISI